MTTKQSLLIQTPMALGLRLLDEQTWHIMASMLMVLCGGGNQYASADAKKVMLDSVENEYRRQVRSAHV